ncbi:hypothetical protein K1719_022839 [Acacia pycnantha]|nr:hypothetical protein K1719_022839 [Acacia pycnantha]
MPRVWEGHEGEADKLLGVGDLFENEKTLQQAIEVANVLQDLTDGMSGSCMQVGVISDGVGNEGLPLPGVGQGKEVIACVNEATNSKGAASADLGRQLRFLTSKYSIGLLVLVETRTNGEKCMKLRKKLGFDSSFVEEVRGFSGGIWVLWKSQEVQVSVLNNSL